MIKGLITAGFITLNLTTIANAQEDQQDLSLGFNTTDECVTGTIKDIFGEATVIYDHADSYEAHEKELWEGDRITIYLSHREEETLIRSVLEIEFETNSTSFYLPNESFHYIGANDLPTINLEAGKISKLDGSAGDTDLAKIAANKIQQIRSALLNCFSMS